MIFDKLFKRTKPEQEKLVCKKCGSETVLSEIVANNMICPYCGAYMRMSARSRIELVADTDSFCEMYSELSSQNLIDFPDYDEKLKKAEAQSGEKDAVVCGTCSIGGTKTAIFVMDSGFMMGSMGTVVGEKITRIFEYAAENRLPVIGFTTSGGARMQEGIFSLMQMAKVSGSVKLHSDAGLLYIAVLTDPTTGGVTASFAMEADITIAEPKALIGFAGARVIERTTGEKLPQGFQRSEFQLEHGFVDMIAERPQIKNILANLLKMHEVRL